MNDRAKYSVARNSVIMLIAQVVIKLLGFFLPSMPLVSSESILSGNMVSQSP
jgi:hypothetical protein